MSNSSKDTVTNHAFRISATSGAALTHTSDISPKSFVSSASPSSESAKGAALG